MYPQESASSEDWMDSEDEIVDNNMFIALDNNNPNCDGIGPNTCDNRNACVWTCDTRRGSDRDRGCCRHRRNRNPSRPTPNRPSRPTPNRPNPNNSGGSFDDGLRQGRREAERIWRDLGRNCASAWNDFQSRVNRRISNNGWNSSGNWRTKSFNRGAREGMNQVVTERENECFRDSSDECDELGNEAARILAFDHCGRVSGMSGGRNRWRRICRDEAITQCRRRISRSVNNECGSPSSRDVRNLQNKCRNKVLTMIGDRFDFEEEE